MMDEDEPLDRSDLKGLMGFSWDSDDGNWRLTWDLLTGEIVLEENNPLAPMND